MRSTASMLMSLPITAPPTSSGFRCWAASSRATGREGIEEYFGELRETWEEFRYVVDEVRDLDAASRSRLFQASTYARVSSTRSGVVDSSDITREYPVTAIVRAVWAVTSDRCFRQVSERAESLARYYRSG